MTNTESVTPTPHGRIPPADRVFTKLFRWAIEVDEDRERPNLAAQHAFIRDFGGNVYAALGRLPALRHVYFTRIFYPSRDHMGA